MASILLKNGTILDYASSTNEKMDLKIENGKIVKIEKNIKETADREIDCTGLYIMPGMIDMHCHLREPGFEYKETIETGAKSAVKGGFTTICPMPNTKPTPDNVETLEWIIRKGKEVNLCNIFPFASVALSDEGMPVENARMIREAMFEANEIGSFISEHCEEKSVSAGAINAGKVAEELGVEGVLPEAEEIMASRDIVIAETNNLHTHICHISTETSVNMIRSAKKRNVKVACETCPHYYFFTEEEVKISGTNAKMNPPLRKEIDRQAIIKGLKDGTIDAIITDHAPHSAEEKEKDLSHAPNGIIGFETALSATITELIDKDHLTYLDMVRLMSYNPAKLLGLKERGEIKENAIADLTIFNPEKEYTYTKEMIVSKSKNTPFIGKKLKGEVVYTIVSGEVKFEKN